MHLLPLLISEVADLPDAIGVIQVNNCCPFKGNIHWHYSAPVVKGMSV